MDSKMFATDKINYLIVDTCTLLHCGDLIATIVATVWFKKLNFKVVIPTIVIRELKGQEYNRTGEKQLNTYLSWTAHPRYKCSTVRLAQEATLVLTFIERCRASGVPHLIYQGIHETRNYPIVVADDLLLDCLLYYHEKFDGNATLITHDWELCCKANVFKMNYIHKEDHGKWRELLRICQVDLHFPYLPTESCERKDKLSADDKQELIYRPMVDCDLDVFGMY